MSLQDPLAVYNAANNVEAVFLRDALLEAGIEAFVIEDLSQVGTWVGGLVPEIHKPQVWVERADAERARPVLEAYERRSAERRSNEITGGQVQAVCEECGQRGIFPAGQRGTVQNCPHCGEFMDIVEGESTEEDFGTAEEGGES